jgi:sugar/nucleoside kinase (ribokinase family)
MFAGAFLYGMIVENDIHFAGHLASLCSAKIVSKLGARMDDNYDEIKQQIRELL